MITNSTASTLGLLVKNLGETIIFYSKVNDASLKVTQFLYSNILQ